MSAIPSATETVRDFGLGLTQPASMMALVLGVSSAGAKNTLEIYSTPNDLRIARGEGPAVECAADVLVAGGGPVAFMGMLSSIAAVLGQVLPTYGTPPTQSSVTKVGSGTPVITVAGTPNAAYSMKIAIVTGGALGTMTYNWSIDNGVTQKASGVVSVVGGVAVPLLVPGFDTGITVTFPAGTYVTADTYAWTSTIVAGGVVAVSGTPALDSHVRVEIIAGGALGTATFRYSLDGYTGDTASERTYSETLTIPSGGTFAIPNLGITLTFSSAFVAGDVYQCDVQCPASNATDLAAAFLVIKATKLAWRFCPVVTSKANGDATAHGILAAALETHLDDLAASSKYRRGMIPSTQADTAAAVATAYANVVATRCLISYGRVRRSTPKPFPGYAFPVTSALDVFAARAAGSLPSTDLKRVRSGPLAEVVKIFHDEFQTPSTLDDVKISTLRTYENFGGYYITQARLKSPAGSDFKLWPLGIVMDIACETVNAGLVQEIGRGVRFVNRDINLQPTDDPNAVVYPGTIDDRDAVTIEDEIGQQLASQLLTPLSAEGFAGHITDVRYSISRTQNVLSTGVTVGTVGIKPLGYIDYLNTVVGFVVDLPAAG